MVDSERLAEGRGVAVADGDRDGGQRLVGVHDEPQCAAHPGVGDERSDACASVGGEHPPELTREVNAACAISSTLSGVPRLASI